MKIKLTALLTLLLFITCSKENSSGTKVSSSDFSEDVINFTDTLIPLNDLGMNLYKGRVGGLYPEGLNMPSGEYAQDLLAASQNVVPRDRQGNPSPTGDIVFISMGASTGGKNMTALINKTRNNPLVNSRLKAMNGNQPAQQAPLSYIANGNSKYWKHVLQIVTQHKSTAEQVQVVYLETDDGYPTKTFPNRPNFIKSEIESCMRTMKTKFINLQILYVLGRPRTFNNNAVWNTEPSPYYFGWACKWAIDDQINGTGNVAYKGTNAVAPMITWGFYQWADSLPRKTDNFYWRWTETKDGLHANDVGQDTLSTRFQKFLFTDPYASIWYSAH